jgi:hypothetical protein
MLGVPLPWDCTENGVVSAPNLKRDLFCAKVTKRELSPPCNSTRQAERGEFGYGLQKDKNHDRQNAYR